MVNNKILVSQEIMDQTTLFIKNLAEANIRQQGEADCITIRSQTDMMSGNYIKELGELVKNENELIGFIGSALEEIQSFLEQTANDLKELDRRYASQTIVE